MRFAIGTGALWICASSATVGCRGEVDIGGVVPDGGTGADWPSEASVAPAHPDSSAVLDGGAVLDSGPVLDSGTVPDSSVAPDSSAVPDSAIVAACQVPGGVADRWIAFDSDRVAYNRDIYVVRADGSQIVRLTTDPSTEQDPAFSYQGNSLAFASDRTGSMQIYVMDLATHAVKELTSLSSGADEPNWSRDGTQIVFHSGASVYIMAADGTNPRIVGTGLDTFNAYKYPSLSADGTEVLFDRNNEIDAIKVDGTAKRYVVQNWTTTEETPALSPDGTNAAYAVVCYTVEQIAVTPFAGYAPDPCKTEFVTPVSAGASRRPAWGPAGVIAFERALSSSADGGGSIGTTAIAISTAPGSDPCDIVGAPGNNRNPSWAPAGFQPQ